MAGPPLPASAWRPALAGAAICAGLVVLDVVWGSDRIISSTVVIAPFLTAVRGTTRQTAAVGALALTACALSGAWNDNFGTVEYLLRLAVVAAGASFAVLAARTRTRLDASRARAALIASVGDIAVESATLDETLERLGDAIVPAFADLLVVDVVRGGAPQRLATRAHGPDASALEAAFGRDSQDIWTIQVPLRARGRELGVLGFAAHRTSARGDRAEELGLARALAGRAALALDNAGLSIELETVEAQLAAAMGSLAEAVTVQDADGRLVYANDAAAALLGFDSAHALLATPPEAIVDRYDVFLEDGSPLTLEHLPGRRVLAGEDPEPLVVRAVEKHTGEERWRIVKATAVRGPGGLPRLAVNVVEDITEAKRAELTQRLLARAGEVLSSTLDPDEALRRLADETVPQLADWCSVHLLAPSGEIRSVAVAHVDPAMLEFAREYRERWPVSPDEPTGPAAVIRDGGSERMEIPDRLLVESVRDPEQLALLRTLGLRSVMTVPIVAGGAPIGALSFVSAESRRTFGAADLALAQELGRRAGTATEHAWLYEERTRIARAADRAVAGQHARDPRLGLGGPVPARGGGEPRGRRLLRRLRRARRLDARRRRRDRPGGGGRRADRRRPLDDAGHGPAAARPDRGSRAAQPRAARPGRDGPVHGRLPRAARDTGRRRGRRRLRRAPAAAARLRRARSGARALGRAARRLPRRALDRDHRGHRAR